MDIFISYSSKTRDAVEQLAQDLEAMGNVVWFDRELTGGRKWWADILEQIRECELFVFTLTPQSLDSFPCKLEYSYANDLKKRILPVLLGDISMKGLPAALQELQMVDYRQHSTAQILALSKALAHLPDAVPIPDPLPIEPETPLAPFSRLNDRITAPSLTSDEQTLLFFDLKAFVEDEASREEAILLLDSFLQRADLLARIEKELTNLRSGSQPAKRLKRPPAPVEPPILQHPDSVISVAFSPDGEYIATGGLDTFARIWEIESRTELYKFPHKHTVYAVAFAPDGNLLLTGSEDRGACIWDATTGELVRRLNGHTSTILSATFSPDGKLALTGSADHTARLWDVKTGETVQIFKGHARGIQKAMFSGANPIVLTGSTDRTVRFWDLHSGNEVRQIEIQQLDVSIVGNELRPSSSDHYSISQIFSIAFSPDERFAFVGDENVILKLDLLEPNLLGSTFWGHRLTARCASFSPDGKSLLVGSRDRKARIWDADRGDIVQTFTGHTGTILGAVYSLDGRYVLTGSSDRTARLWDVANQ